MTDRDEIARLTQALEMKQTAMLLETPLIRALARLERVSGGQP